MSSQSLQQWLESGAHLPDFMRDFHGQKDLFKTIHELVSMNDGTKSINWMDAHIYTIDVFLWFMAKRGYTLQRCRAKQDFYDIRKTIADQTKRRDDAATAALMSAFGKAPQPADKAQGGE